MPSSSAYPMSSPRTSAFSEFSLVPARAPDNYQDIHYKNQQHCDSPVLDHGNMTSTSASTSSASHNLPAAPDREKLLIMEQARATPHVRTNFRRGYHPPATKDNPVRRPPPIERQENSDASKPRTSDTSDRSDEMPFDVKNDKIKPPHQQQQRQQHGAGQPRHPPTTWAAREELDPGRGRFVITPPKYSDPTSLNSVHHPTATYGFRRDEEKSVVTTLGMAGAASTLTGRVEDHYSSPHRVIAPTPDPCDNYEEFGISLGTIRARTGRKGEIDNPEDEDSLFEFELESSSHPPGLPKIGSNRKSTHVQHRRRRAQRQQQQHEHAVVEEDDRDDDTASLEEIPYGHKTPSPTNLHERTTQAWAVRREKVSSLKTNKSKEDTRPKMQTKSKEEPITPTSPSKEESLIKQGVSFGQTDTVHHFQPHIVEDDDDGTFGTYNSVEDHSLNSEYTKTIESEVEDVIKDILFIGTEFKSKPGRRKLKYRHEVKRKLQQQKMKIYEGDEASAGADDKTNDAETDDVAVISKYLVNISNDQKATPSNPVKSRNSKNKVSSTLEKSSQQKTARHIERRNSLEETPPSNSPIRSTRESERRAKTEKQTSKAHREEKEEDDDPFLAMWGYVEGGMKAMSEALGLDPDPTETTEKKASSSSSKTSSSLSQKKAAKSSSTRSKSSDKNLCTDQIALILSGDEACPYSPTKTTRKAAPMVEADQGLDGFIDYAQDTMFGPLPSIGTGGSGVSFHGNASSIVENQQISHFPLLSLSSRAPTWVVPNRIPSRCQ
jgi:hypothetical protein